MVNRINPKEAPQGYVARRPKKVIYKSYSVALCVGCDFYDNPTCLNHDFKEPFCTARTRNDKRDVIFVKKS